MEKKKILLVAISVGVFLVVVIGASILVFSPRNPVPAVSKAQVPERPIPPGSLGSGITGYPAPDGSASPIQVQPATVDPSDMLRNSSGLQGLQTPPSSASAVQENRFYINNDGNGTDQPFLIERKEGDSNTRVVINVPRPATTAVPSAAPASRSAPASRPAPAASPAPAKSTPAPAAVPRAASPAPKPAAAPARAAAVAARPAAQAQTRSAAPKTYDAYWVQTGSFAAKVRADGVKETLASKGITAIIENRDVDGRTFYRVRVGPYTSQNEADYWLSLIKSINGFEDSQVWKSQVRQ